MRVRHATQGDVGAQALQMAQAMAAATELSLNPLPRIIRSADEALERVQRSFDTRQDGGRRSPETDEQIALVKAFVSSARAAA